MAKRATKPSSSGPAPSIGERLRAQRIQVLGKSLRDVAKQLETAPIHLSDIETGKRSPSEELLVKLAGVYRLSESELRAGFARPDAVVAEVASESSVAAEKVPQFLRTVRGMSAEKWDLLIKQAKELNPERTPEP